MYVTKLSVLLIVSDVKEIKKPTKLAIRNCIVGTDLTGDCDAG